MEGYPRKTENPPELRHIFAPAYLPHYRLPPTKIEPALKKSDLQQLFTMRGLKGLCAPGPEGEPVRISMEENIWRWVWLGVAILVFTIAIVLANNVR